MVLGLALELGAALLPEALAGWLLLGADGAALEELDAPLLGCSVVEDELEEPVLGVEGAAELDEDEEPDGWSLFASIETEPDADDAGGVPDGVLLVPAEEEDEGADGAGVVAELDEDEGADGAGVVVVLDDEDEPADGRSALAPGRSGPRSQP